MNQRVALVLAQLLEAAGFTSCGVDESAGARILRENDLEDAPLFLLWARK